MIEKGKAKNGATTGNLGFEATKLWSASHPLSRPSPTSPTINSPR
jgi:hypothetical protein